MIAVGIENVEPGCVLQISPEFETNPAFRCCMLVVSEVKSWGVQGYVQALGETREKMGGQAFIRCTWEDVAPLEIKNGVALAAWDIDRSDA